MSATRVSLFVGASVALFLALIYKVEDRQADLGEICEKLGGVRIVTRSQALCLDARVIIDTSKASK